MGKNEGKKLVLHATWFVVVVLFLAFAGLTIALGELKTCSYYMYL